MQFSRPDEGEITSVSSTSGDTRHRKRARTDKAPAVGPGIDQNIDNPDLRMFLTRLRNQVPSIEELKETTLNMLRQDATGQVDAAYHEKVSQEIASFFKGEMFKITYVVPLQNQDASGHTNANADEKIATIQQQIIGMKELMGQYERQLDQVVQAGEGDKTQPHFPRHMLRGDGGDSAHSIPCSFWDLRRGIISGRGIRIWSRPRS